MNIVAFFYFIKRKEREGEEGNVHTYTMTNTEKKVKRQEINEAQPIS